MRDRPIEYGLECLFYQASPLRQWAIDYKWYGLFTLGFIAITNVAYVAMGVDGSLQKKATLFLLNCFGWWYIGFLLVFCIGVFETLVEAFFAQRPWPQVWDQIEQNVIGSITSNWVCSLMIMLTQVLFLRSVHINKLILTNSIEYTWDSSLATMDSWLLGGHSTWHLVTTWLGHPAIITLLQHCYEGWFIFQALMMSWMMVSSKRCIAKRFWLVYSLTWTVLGNGLAVLLASMGPYMFGLVTHADWIGSFTQQLGVNNPSLLLQNVMVDQLQQHGHEMIGISAFPSIHSAMACLMARTSFALGHWSRWFFLIFAGLVALACMVLGWHYLIDVLAGMFGVCVLWWLVDGFLQERDEARSHQ